MKNRYTYYNSQFFILAICYRGLLLLLHFKKRDTRVIDLTFRLRIDGASNAEILRTVWPIFVWTRTTRGRL